MHSINLDSFSHGQIISKIWLCEELEHFIQPDSSIHILGGWYNVLGFMLSVRKPDYYRKIVNIDIDADAIVIADKICNPWIIGYNHSIYNQIGDCNTVDYSMSDVVINCSVEHFANNDWYDNIPAGTIVCIQSSDITDPEEPWLIKQANPDFETFLQRFPVTNALFVGTKRIQYSHFGYTRFMLIGRK
jgi:hypothetical protein